MNTLSQNGLFELLVSLNGATIVNVTTISAVRMNKRGNPFVENGNEVTKQTTRTCQFGYSYENAVNNRLEKQGDERTFKSESLSWGEWEIPNKIIAHKGKRYGRFYSLNGGNETTTIYFVDGVVASPEQVAIIKTFEVGHSHGSGRQAEEGLTENQVKPMNIALDTILTIKVNKETYQVEKETETETELA